MHLIFSDGFWFVQIPSVSMVKFKLLAQFSVNHLATCTIFTINAMCEMDI